MMKPKKNRPAGLVYKKARGTEKYTQSQNHKRTQIWLTLDNLEKIKRCKSQGKGDMNEIINDALERHLAYLETK